MTATLTTLSTSFSKLTRWLTPTPLPSPPLLHHKLASDDAYGPDGAPRNYCPNCGVYWPNDEVAMYSLDAVYDLELLQALGNRAFNRYKWSRDRILKVRARVHRTLDVQQEQVNSDIEALKRKIICNIYGHGFDALTAWDEYLASRKHWSGSELRDLEHQTDDLQRGWIMFVTILDDAEAKQAAQAKQVGLAEDPESLPSSSQSSPSDEYMRYARSPRSSAETGFRHTGSAAKSSRHRHHKGRHSSSSARSPSPATPPESEDDHVVAGLLARNTRSWMPRTPRRRSSRESDYGCGYEY